MMIAALLAVFLAPAAPAAKPASLSFDQVVVTSVDGKPGPTQKSRVYWSGRKVRLESGDEFDPLVLLLDMARERAYRLDPVAKKARVLDVEALRARSHLGFSMAGDQLGAGEDFRRTPLPNRREIAGFTCAGHVLRAGQTRIEVWSSERVPVEAEAFTELLEWTGAGEAMGGLLPELVRQGFPLETRSRTVVDGHVYETRATITRVATGALPTALFDVPDAFAVEDEADPDP
jgi:hypothetical protein